MTQTSTELLIAKFLNDPTDENLKGQVNEFRLSSPSNERYFKEIEKIWNLSDDAIKLNDTCAENARLALLDKIAVKPIIKQTNFSFWIKGIAASMLIFCLGYWLYNSRNEEIVLITKTTRINEIDTVKLNDGSIVTLAENSELKYPAKFELKYREVSLTKGKAFFNVARDVNKPFSVVLNKSSVSVLGTSFNIITSSSQIDLDVKTGKVVFSPYKGATTLMLTAGQALSYDVQKSQLISKKSQNSDAWITKELSFVDTPLEEVCEQLTKYYNKQIKLDNTKKIIKKFNATFRDEELDEVLSLLKATYNLKVEKREDIVLLKTP